MKKIDLSIKLFIVSGLFLLAMSVAMFVQANVVVILSFLWLSWLMGAGALTTKWNKKDSQLIHS